MDVSSTMINKLSQLSPERFLIISTLLDELADNNNTSTTPKRIGVAKDINFPSNFGEIDYGVDELFGLK